MCRFFFSMGYVVLTFSITGANIKPINKQKLELLELEMRARAIKKMLASQQQNESSTNHPSNKGKILNLNISDKHDSLMPSMFTIFAMSFNLRAVCRM